MGELDEGRVRRLDSLTGLRFVAAFLVFLFHAGSMGVFAMQGTRNDGYSLVTQNGGALGVSFFFVLSGFVLTWAARETATFRGFWRRRFFKIFPNHLVTFVVAVLLYASISAAVLPAVLNVTLLHAWVPKVDTFTNFNYPTWSLSCELLFYVLFPFLLKALGKIRPQRLWWWAGGVVAVIACVPLLAWLVIPGDPTYQARWMRGPDFTESVYQYWFVYIFPPVRLLEFVLGILMARIVLTGRWIRIHPAIAAGLVAVGYVAGIYLPFHYSLVAATIIPVALLIPAFATLDARGARTPLSRKPMVWLGEISFAFYMLHVIVLFYARERIGLTTFLSPLAGTAWIVAMFALTLVLAWLLYAAVERPIMRRWASPRRRAREPVAEPAL